MSARARDRAARLGPLLLLALLAAASNAGKAVHVDDTAHLEIAQAILRDPLHPMAQLVNWGDTAEPIHAMNQPHLLFYPMALVLRAAPRHAELALHLVWGLFSGAAIVLFHALARRLAAPRPLLWTAILALGPAFLPAQNLMVDVPLLAFWLAFFLLLTGAEGPGRFAAAGLVLGAACLVKYTSLALLPVYALAVLRRGGARWLTCLLIPAAVLAAYALFNWLDYGGVHILTRPTPAAGGALHAVGALVARGGLWMIALGAVTLFSPAFVPLLSRDRPGRRLLALAAAVAAVAFGASRLALAGEPLAQSVLRGIFLANGLLVAGLAARAARAGQAEGWILLAWAGAAAAFIVVLSPFVAVRHVLLALPAIYLIVARGPDAARLSRPARLAALDLAVLGGLALAASDAALADVYRRAAPALAARHCARSRCVALGHWGWQWYASRAGFSVYDARRTALVAGDRLIIPELPAKQRLRPADAARLSLIDEVVVPAGPLTWIRTIATERSGPQGDRSGGTYYFWTSVPWTLTARPLDRFRIYQVR